MRVGHTWRRKWWMVTVNSRQQTSIAPGTVNSTMWTNWEGGHKQLKLFKPLTSSLPNHFFCTCSLYKETKSAIQSLQGFPLSLPNGTWSEWREFRSINYLEPWGEQLSSRDCLFKYPVEEQPTQGLSLPLLHEKILQFTSIRRSSECSQKRKRSSKELSPGSEDDHEFSLTWSSTTLLDSQG